MSGVPAEATPERLTAVLRRAGVLTRGEVVDVAVETSRDTLISRIARLRLTYAQGDDAGPSHVFFKTSREDAAEALRELGRKEVTFYDVVAVATPPGLLPRCYEAAAEPAGRWHVMLEDLTASHEPLGEWPLPPPMERWHAVVAAHARFHAVWWDHERLGVSVGGVAVKNSALARQLGAVPNDMAMIAVRMGIMLSHARRQQ